MRENKNLLEGHFLKVYQCNQSICDQYSIYIETNHRSSHRRCSVRKGILRSFAKFTWKNTCARVSFLIKLQASACEFCEISKNTFFCKHLVETASVINCFAILNKESYWLQVSATKTLGDYSGKTKMPNWVESLKLNSRGGLEEIQRNKEVEVFWVANDRQNTSSSLVRSSNTFNKNINKHSVTAMK